MALGRCPRDSNLLQSRVVGPGMFYVCGHCHGILVEAAALRAFLKTPIESWKLPALQSDQVDLPHVDRSASCLCSCGLLMETRRHHGTAIDVCGECGAVWLDGGELASLLERNREGPEGPERTVFGLLLDFLSLTGDWI